MFTNDALSPSAGAVMWLATQNVSGLLGSQPVDDRQWGDGGQTNLRELMRWKLKLEVDRRETDGSVQQGAVMRWQALAGCVGKEAQKRKRLSGIGRILWMVKSIAEKAQKAEAGAGAVDPRQIELMFSLTARGSRCRFLSCRRGADEVMWDEVGGVVKACSKGDTKARKPTSLFSHVTSTSLPSTYHLFTFQLEMHATYPGKGGRDRPCSFFDDWKVRKRSRDSLKAWEKRNGRGFEIRSWHKFCIIGTSHHCKSKAYKLQDMVIKLRCNQVMQRDEARVKERRIEPSMSD